MPTATATVQMDEQGRITIPKPVREKLGVNGVETYVEIEVQVDE